MNEEIISYWIYMNYLMPNKIPEYIYPYLNAILDKCEINSWLI